MPSRGPRPHDLVGRRRWTPEARPFRDEILAATYRVLFTAEGIAQSVEDRGPDSHQGRAVDVRVMFREQRLHGVRIAEAFGHADGHVDRVGSRHSSRRRPFSKPLCIAHGAPPHTAASMAPAKARDGSQCLLSRARSAPDSAIGVAAGVRVT